MNVERALEALGRMTPGALPLVEIEGRSVTLSHGWTHEAVDVAVRRSTPLVVVTDTEDPPALTPEGHSLRVPIIAIGRSPWAISGADLRLLVGAEGPADHDGLQEAQAAAIARRYLRLTFDGRPQPATFNGSLLDVVPFAIDEPYRPEDILDYLVDGAWIALDAKGPAEVLTAVTRIGGYSVGIAASRPAVDGGRLSPAGCARVARLVEWCERRGRPFVALVDTSGGPDAADIDELEVFAHAAAAVRHADPTTIAIVVGRAIGLAATVMGAVGGRADAVLPWPRAQFALRLPVTNSEAEAANIARAAREGDVMDIIHPDSTRSTVIELLEVLRGRTEYADD